MAQTHYQLLSRCTDDQLRTICQMRRLPLPQFWEDGPEGRVRLLKTMVFHLEDHKRLANTLADLDGDHLKALKRLAEEGLQPPSHTVESLSERGLILPDGTQWTVVESVTDALADFDEGALTFQGEDDVVLEPAPSHGFALALTSVLLRCMGGIRVLKGGLPAKKELGQILNRNGLLEEERDATLAFALLHRLGFLWDREGRVNTLLPAVLDHPSRWVAERAFAKLLEDDLKLWNLPPAEDRAFLMRHLLERQGQILAVQPFLTFLATLQPIDEKRTREVFLPFLRRMGLVAMDAEGQHLSLTAHGEALAREYLLRDSRGTEAHWMPFMVDQPLVIQPNLELLTPMGQNPHRLLLLAQIGEVEAMDAMLNLRLGADTLIRALDAGVSLDEIRQRLEEGGANLPQTLRQLLEDLAHRLGEVEVVQGVRLVKTRTAELAQELTVRPELASLQFEALSDTVLEAKGPGNAFALLKQAGFLPKPGRYLPLSLDGDESLYLWALACLAFVNEKGMNHHLEPVKHMIQAALQRVQSEDPALFSEITRRVPMLNQGGGSQGQEETQRILEYAVSYNLMAEITYIPLAAHRSQQRRVTPQAIEEEHLRAFCHLHQEEMAFRLSRIIGVRLLSEKGWTPSLHSQAG
ncbi:MAG: helicase-associated domain-containing protein [Firmicutes bacterium]|nr:helicase-associated domain-containing protein [Bacillota bacterium]